MKEKPNIEIQCSNPDYIQQLLVEIIYDQLHIQPKKDNAA